jgi:ubiquinone/menaquinone biosynthesis C-methylase UbiE
MLAAPPLDPDAVEFAENSGLISMPAMPIDDPEDSLEAPVVAEKPAPPLERPAEKPVEKAPPPVADKPPPPVEKAPPPPPAAERAPTPPTDKPAEKPAPPPPPAGAKTTIPPPPGKAPPPVKAPPPAVPITPLPAAPAASSAAGAQARLVRRRVRRALREHRPQRLRPSAELDAAFIRKSAELGAGQTLLDVGCGDGRHCFAFANLGLIVTGLDCSLPQLVRAAQRNEATEAGITLLQGDMRSLPRDRTYDVVTCLGSTLGYFESEEQNKQCLQEMVDVLRPGGKLVLQMFNRDNLVAVLPCRSWWQGRGCLVLDVADMNYFTNRMRVHRTVVFEDGRQFEHQMYIRTFSLHELGRMLTGMGMRVLEVSGSRETRGRFYGATSAEIWLVAQRREDA